MASSSKTTIPTTVMIKINNTNIQFEVTGGVKINPGFPETKQKNTMGAGGYIPNSYTDYSNAVSTIEFEVTSTLENQLIFDNLQSITLNGEHSAIVSMFVGQTGTGLWPMNGVSVSTPNGFTVGGGSLTTSVKLSGVMDKPLITL